MSISLQQRLANVQTQKNEVYAFYMRLCGAEQTLQELIDERSTLDVVVTSGNPEEGAE